MALSIEQLYRQYAGREADPGGLEYWKKQFGSDVDPNEVAVFQRALAENIAKGTETQASKTQWWTGLQPSEKIKYYNELKITPEQLKTAGVSPTDIAWMQSQGYTGGAAPVAAAQTTATTAPASATVPVKTIGEAPNRPVLPSLKDQILWQWKTLGITDIPGGLSLEDRAAGLAERLQANQITDLSQLGLKRQEANVDEYGNPTPVLSQLTYDGRTIGFLGNIGDGGRNASPTGYLQGGDLASWSALGEGATSYYARQAPNGQVYLVPSWGQTGGLQSLGGLEKALLLGGSMLIAPWVAGQIGAATGLTGANLAAATGATLGGTTGLIAGGDLESALKGALLGGAGGYLSNALASGITDTNTLQAAFDADVAAGMVPEFGTNAAYDAFMTGAMTPAARAAIEAQIAGSSVAGMTPEQILQQGGMITDMAAGNFMGPQTAEQLGQGFEDYMRQAGYEPIPQGDYSNEGRNYPTTISTIGTGGLTAGKVLDAVSTGAKVAGLLGAGSAVAGESGKGFEIVPIPSDWRTPTYTQAAARTLPPIDFGTRELLRGTQWEKFLNPAQPAIVPAPQVGMNYGDLMNVLQNRQGGTLTLNDIISGITSQYGQTTPSAVG